ncbi:hypothetical protein [Leucobacter musarum]|uniref:hypothetical protein n=1 Tax=Leucobacter musarum TaxID=1930747 RepID=UPI0006A772E3|nr:hypothetical protein [Leucobacter musarum]
MAERSNLIQVASDEWIVMREFAQYPKAVIRGIRDTAGEARYVLLAWHPVRHQQRMVGIFATRTEAERAVPWPSRSPKVPGRADAPLQPGAAAAQGSARGSAQAGGSQRSGGSPRAQSTQRAQPPTPQYPPQNYGAAAAGR